MDEITKEKILLWKLTNEIKFLNEIATTEQEFCACIMEWNTKIERIMVGIDSLPQKWLHEYLNKDKKGK